jgi:archaellum biogenesis protein FlaJ (TadC family)
VPPSPLIQLSTVYCLKKRERKERKNHRGKKKEKEERKIKEINGLKVSKRTSSKNGP